MVTKSALRRFTVDEYARMWRAGILTEDERVELIGGEIREMSPIGPVHAAIVKRLNALLSQRLVGAAIISVQDPIQLDDLSQPQPDLAILQFRSDYYADAHPVAEALIGSPIRSLLSRTFCW